MEAKWFKVRNGRQIDIHYKDTVRDREFTVASNMREGDANLIVLAVNSRAALLAACKAMDAELMLLAAQGKARQKPSLDIISQMRAAIALDQALLLPGGAYLVAAERSVMTIPFPTLRDHVTTVLHAVREDAA